MSLIQSSNNEASMISYYVVSITVLLWKILREVQLSLSYDGVYRQDKN